MKILLTFLLLFVSFFSFGQFAIIHDKDGYSNVRNSPELKGEIANKLNNGHLVYAFESKGNWTSIGYTKNRRELDGYIYHDRLKFVSDYQSVPIINNGDKSVTLSKDSLKIIVTLQKFDKSKYKLTYYKEAKDYIEFINGKQYWGTDGELPRSEYESIIVHIGQRKMVLPKAALDNLFEPNLNNTEVNYDRVNDTIYIQSMNSDGAGYYTVAWKIEKGVYKDRYVAYGF